MLSRILKLATLMYLVFGNEIAYSKIKKIEYERPVRVNISNQGLNQLDFGVQVVTNLWGDERHYQAELAADGRHLFISSNKAAGEEIGLAVSLAGGEVINLILVVQAAKEGKLVRLRLVEKQEARDRKETSLVKKQALLMLKAMREGARGKYEVKRLQQVLEVKLFTSSMLKLTGSKVYYSPNLTGYYFLIRNELNNRQRVSNERIASYFPASILVAVDREELAPGEQGKVFVIRKNELQSW